MTPTPAVTNARRDLQTRLFPEGIPALWCPLLTHYDSDGSVHEQRILAHLGRVASFVTGFLIPGSTGDGWEHSEAERLRVLGLVLDQATRLKLQILVAVLKPTTAAMRASLIGTLEWLKHRSGETDALRCLVRRRIGGFTICPPSGSEKTQAELKTELEDLMDSGFPLALYQLPQVTGNSVEPAIINQLAARHPNFLLFKDSSGDDGVAQHRPQPSGVFLLRGAEGDYARWLRLAGGSYDGFLLSSANCFPRELKHLLRDLQRHRLADARMLSQRLTAAVTAVFDVVQHHLVPGNAFAAANKAMDHFMAFGPNGVQVDPPRLHGGRILPPPILRQTADILRRHDLLPPKGYLD